MIHYHYRIAIGWAVIGMLAGHVLTHSKMPEIYARAMRQNAALRQSLDSLTSAFPECRIDLENDNE